MTAEQEFSYLLSGSIHVGLDPLLGHFLRRQLGFY